MKGNSTKVDQMKQIAIYKSSTIQFSQIMLHSLR